MSTHKLTCPVCSEPVGSITYHPWTSHGQDPPEEEIFDNTVEDSDGTVYCSESCMNKARGNSPESENEDGCLRSSVEGED